MHQTCWTNRVDAEEKAKGLEEKPAASIFATACEMAGCSASEAIHVGDSLGADIQGAINAGLQGSVWVNAQGQSAPQGSPAFSCSIRHISALVPLLEKST